LAFGIFVFVLFSPLVAPLSRSFVLELPLLFFLFLFRARPPVREYIQLLTQPFISLVFFFSQVLTSLTSEEEKKKGKKKEKEKKGKKKKKEN